MTDQTLLPPPDEPVEPAVVSTKAPRRNLVPWLYSLGFVVLAAAIFYLWQYPDVPSQPAAEVSALQAVQQHLETIDTRLAQLDKRPTPDFAQLAARVDALDGKVAAQTQVASRLDTLSGRIESLSGRDQTGMDAAKQELAALTSRVSALEASAGSLNAVTNKLNLLAQVEQATLALRSGQPLGDLPGAPAALARYAKAPPPTEAQLRVRFPAEVQAALAAKQPDNDNAPFVSRVWQRAQGLITVRRGDDIVIGNDSAVTLNHAYELLDAGDLAGAVADVKSLAGQPGQAMAKWLSDAQGLLAARSALAQLAEKA